MSNNLHSFLKYMYNTWFGSPQDKNCFSKLSWSPRTMQYEYLFKDMSCSPRTKHCEYLYKVSSHPEQSAVSTYTQKTCFAHPEQSTVSTYKDMSRLTILLWKIFLWHCYESMQDYCDLCHWTGYVETITLSLYNYISSMIRIACDLS